MASLPPDIQRFLRENLLVPRSFSTFTELRAIHSSFMQGGEVVTVLSGVIPVMVWNEGSTDADDGTTAIKPSDLSSSDAGRWVKIAQGASSAGTDVVDTFTAENKSGGTILKGQWVAMHSSGTGVILADATAPGKEAVGIATADVASTFAGTFKTNDVLQLADWTDSVGSASLAARAQYWLSTTPGRATASPPSTPGKVVQSLGFELASDTLSVMIQPAILL